MTKLKIWTRWLQPGRYGHRLWGGVVGIVLLLLMGGVAYAAIHTDTQFQGFIVNGKTEIRMRVCGTGTYHRIGVVQLPAVDVPSWDSGNWGWVNGCQPPSPNMYQMVFNALPGEKFRFYSLIMDAPLSSAEFIQQARRDDCTVITTGTVSCARVDVQASPTSLNFYATQGGGNPAAQAFIISSNGLGPVNWTASDNTTRLSLSSTSGTTPATVNASVNISDLNAGTYNWQITVSSPGVTGSPQTIYVTLTITSPGYPFVVYNNANYTGALWCYSVGAGPNNVASTCNDQISSFTLQSGWSVRLYQDANQANPTVSRCFTASDSDLSNDVYDDGLTAINNTASSFVLYQQASCPDITPPSGSITSPADGFIVNPGTVINIKANASDNIGGSGVNRVEFHVLYGGAWHPVSTDSTPPYETTWSSSIPQQVTFTIHVIDNAGNEAMNPGGLRRVTFSNAEVVPPPPPPPPPPIGETIWPVPYYWQGDPQWKSEKLGGYCDIINNVGCAVTSLAMVFQYYGVNHNPKTLNTCIGSNACYLPWGGEDVKRCGGGKVTWAGWPLYNNTNPQLVYPLLEQELKSRPVILEIRNGGYLHFIVVLGGSGSDPKNYTVNDPGMKGGGGIKLSQTLAAFKMTPSSMRLYSGTPAFKTADIQLAAPLPPLVSPQPLAGEIITGTVVLYRSTETDMTLELAAQSTAGAITEMKVWTDQTANDVWQPFTSYVAIPLGNEYYAQFRDAAGNTSAIVKVGIPVAPASIQADLSSIYLPLIIK